MSADQQSQSGVYTSQTSYTYNDPVLTTSYQTGAYPTTQYTATTNYGVSGTSPYSSNVGTYGTTTYEVGKTSGTYGTATGTYGTASGSYVPADTYGKTSGTYGTTAGVYGTTSGTYGATGTGLSTSQVIGGTNYVPTTSYTATGTAGDYAAGTTSYSNYQPATYTSTYTSNYGTTDSSAPINDFLGGLRTSVIYEIKKNMDTKGSQFGRELRSHLESNVVGKPEESRQNAVLDTLKQYNLISSERLSDPHKVWQSINPNQKDQYSSIPGSYLPQTTGTTYTVRDPATYTSTYQVTTTTTNYDSSTFKTPDRANIEAEKRSTLSPSRVFTSEQRQGVLSPYRNSSYKEFELVEDLPDRKNLIDSINLFLRKSPTKEALLVSPSRVSITRKSLLSPAEIEVTSLLKEKYEDGSIYEGESRDGVRHGKGKIFYKDGRVFEGDFVDGKGEGTGKVLYKNGKVCYEGGFSNTRFEGQGVLSAEAPLPLQGAFNYKNLEAIGNNWTRYEGEFKDGKKHGKGTLSLTNGEKFTGEWRYDIAEGNGVFSSIDGRNIQGVWRNNILQEN